MSRVTSKKWGKRWKRQQGPQIYLCDAVWSGRGEKIAVSKTDEAVAALDVFGVRGDALKKLALDILERDR
jgi:ribulose 1,5-bisphosphate synthetase/thiazole synthase